MAEHPHFASLGFNGTNTPEDLPGARLGQAHKDGCVNARALRPPSPGTADGGRGGESITAHCAETRNRCPCAIVLSAQERE